MSIDHRLGMDPLAKRMRVAVMTLLAINLAMLAMLFFENWSLHHAMSGLRGEVQKAFIEGVHACAAPGKHS